VSVRLERAAWFARWALLVLAAAAAMFALGIATRAPRPGVGWVCPMHPDSRAVAPGSCLLCGMALVPLGPRLSSPAEAGPRLPSGAVEPVRSRVVDEPLRAPAWVEGDRVIARVYDDALATLAPGERLTFHPAAAPGQSFDVSAAPGPFARWDRSTSRVELRLAPGARVGSGTAGWIEAPARARPQTLVSISAVLEDAQGPYVLVRTGASDFVRRPVHLGRTLDGSAAVVSGLEEGERVLIRGAFFVDAERRLAPGAEGSGR